jgi:hypothetical protein
MRCGNDSLENGPDPLNDPYLQDATIAFQPPLSVQRSAFTSRE